MGGLDSILSLQYHIRCLTNPTAGIPLGFITVFFFLLLLGQSFLSLNLALSLTASLSLLAGVVCVDEEKGEGDEKERNKAERGGMRENH
jgi:hypothetical protein